MDLQEQLLKLDQEIEAARARIRADFAAGNIFGSAGPAEAAILPSLEIRRGALLEQISPKATNNNAPTLLSLGAPAAVVIGGIILLVLLRK